MGSSSILVKPWQRRHSRSCPRAFGRRNQAILRRREERLAGELCDLGVRESDAGIAWTDPGIDWLAFDERHVGKISGLWAPRRRPAPLPGSP